METQNATETSPPEYARRRFLKVFVGLFSSLIGAVLAIPFVSAVIGGSSRAKAGDFSSVGSIGPLPVGTPVDIAYTEMGSDAYLSQETVHHIWVVKRSASDVAVYSPVCPHLGCRNDFLHMMRVFLWGAYKNPREVTWLLGVFLFLLTMVMMFTGSPLPWDEKGYWATEVGTSMAGTVPLLGDFTKRLLRGGELMGQLTISRFFILHVALLSGLLAAFIGLHLVALRRNGSAGAWAESDFGASGERRAGVPHDDHFNRRL
ncbi:MAG: cytochrome b N-terminal domain-containing protein [Candidatus Aminicenantales bacterium]